MSNKDHHHNTPERGCHGVPLPPDDATLATYRQGGMRGAEPVPLHFFANGPLDVRPVRPKYIRLRDGTYQRCTWEFRWYLDRIDGVSYRTALDRLYDVLLAPNGWIQAGVHWKRVWSRDAADILVRVIPQDTTVCGAGAAGCYSWGQGTPVAEMGVEYVDRPGPFAALVGMELQGHGTFRADDQYLAVHLPYPSGVMGSWESMAAAGYMPTGQEIADSVTWLAGQTPADRVHWH